MHVLVNYKNEDDSIKNERVSVVTAFSHYKYMGMFPAAQGQLTQQSMVGPGQISNSFGTLWLSWLPAEMKRSDQK